MQRKRREGKKMANQIFTLRNFNAKLKHNLHLIMTEFGTGGGGFKW
jgi:hypothetical protein